MSPAEFPLFPLRTVLFPGCELDLRIFETRYLDMVRNCLRNGTDFVVVAIERGAEVGEAEPCRVGTTARIVDWSSEAGGLLGLRVRGVERFEIESYRRAADGLYLGSGRLLPPGDTAADHAWAADLLRALLDDPAATGSAARNVLDDPDRVCWNLAARLPLPLSEKQALLELNDLDLRFRHLRRKAVDLVEEIQGDN